MSEKKQQHPFNTFFWGGGGGDVASHMESECKEWTLPPPPPPPFLNFDLCVVQWCSDWKINNQKYKSLETYAVSIKILLTITIKYTVDLMVYSNTTVYGEKTSHVLYMYVNLVTCIHFFEALNS